MPPRSGMLLTFLNIYLLMSAHPIGAVRVSEIQALALDVSRAEATMKDLQQALHEEQQEEMLKAYGSHQYIGEIFASCSQRQEDFNRRSGKVLTRIQEANKDGKVDAFEAAGIVLKARDLAKTLVKAQEKGCDWVKEKSVDKATLEQIVKVTAAKNPCFEKAQALLEGAKGASAEVQQQNFSQAMEVLLSSKCQASAVQPEAPKETVAALDAEVDEAANDLGEKAVDKAANKGFWDRLTGSALAEIQEGLRQGSTLAEMEASGGFDEAIAKFVGFLILVILWALFCWALLAVILAFLGVIMCMLKALILSLINIFKTDKWEVDLGGCIGWWFSLAGHTTPGHVGTAMCAASAMSGWL